MPDSAKSPFCTKCPMLAFYAPEDTERSHPLYMLSLHVRGVENLPVQVHVDIMCVHIAGAPPIHVQGNAARFARYLCHAQAYPTNCDTIVNVPVDTDEG